MWSISAGYPSSINDFLNWKCEEAEKIHSSFLQNQFWVSSGSFSSKTLLLNLRNLRVFDWFRRMMVAKSFDLWQKDVFFSAAEEVQQSADT